ncbi:hypothetical protein PAV_1c00170 [Paenibacillus alvei DSM 29]|nr:hypothetical protein PAV_1c00170 [Paenibacillus alvei DSM 29]
MIIKVKSWRSLTSGEKMSALEYMVYLTEKMWEARA